MKKTLAYCMAILLTAVSLAGCAGDTSELDAEIEGLEQEELRLRGELETAQAEISDLESQYQKLLSDFTEQQESATVIFEDGYATGWNEGYYDGWDEGYYIGSAENSPVSTLDMIMERGTMKCGIKESQYGMGYLDGSTGVRSGLDIEYCRAIAAAIGLNPDTDIEYIPASGSDRFEKLSYGIIDVLIRTTTWTTSRDAGLNADFAGINFYDGQGIMVRSDFITAADAGNSAYGLDGANICVGIGTTTEGNLQDWFSTSGISFDSVGVADAAQANEMFIDGSCDAYTGDMSSLVAKKYTMVQNGDMSENGIWIAQETISKEPLAAVTRDYDSEWNEIVSWVWYAMVTAEEMGISSTNYGSADTSDPSVDRLLYSNLGLGTDANPLSSTWMLNVLDWVGNYGEAYDRSFCDGSYDGVSGSDAMTGCLISRSGTYNALVSEGGLQYAPSMR